MTTHTKAAFQTTKAERISYPLFAIGQMFIFGFITQFLQLFFTNTLFIAPAVLSIIFIIAKVWDAVNDPIFGMIVDKVSFKKNKFKPWLRVTAFIVPLFTLLIFWISPSWPMHIKIALAAIGYIAWSMVYTVSDVPAFSLMTTLTNNMRERTTLLSYGSVAGSLGALILTIVFASSFQNVGFKYSAIVICAVAIPLLAIYPFVAKERFRPKPNKEKHGIKEIFTFLKGNKFLAIFYAAFCVQGILNVGQTLTNYVMIYCYGGLHMLAVFVGIGVVPVIALFLLIPKISQVIDRMTIYRFCLIALIILNITTFFVGYKNFYLSATLIILRTVLATPSTLLVATFTTDCIEYGQYKTGLRKEGLTFSVQTFFNKFNNAIASSLGMALLGIVGFIGEDSVQAAFTMSGMWVFYNLIPAVGALIALPLLHFYKLKTKDIQIMTDINGGKLSREEGDKLLSRTY